jgi:flagellar assembly protein FliH
MLIKKKILNEKFGVKDLDTNKVILNNLKSKNGDFSFASKSDVEDSLDLLYDETDFETNFQNNLISDEEISAKAHDLVEEKIKQLYEDYQAEIAEKRNLAELELDRYRVEEKNKANIEANAIVDDARIQAKEIIAIANKEIQKLELEKQAFSDQMLIERQKALDDALQKADSYMKEFISIISSFNKSKALILEEIKPQIASIALDVAKQILEYEVDTNPNLLEDQLTKAISKLINTKGVMQIYLHPENVGQVDYLDTALSKVLDSSVRLIFIKDDSVDKGSCLINTQGGRLDSRFSIQFDLIKVVFEKYLGHKIYELDNLIENINDDDFLDYDKELEMSGKEIIKPSKHDSSYEPSDDDLDLLENDPEAFVDLSLDDDLDSLLQDVFIEDEKPKEVKSKTKSKSKSQSQSKEPDYKLDHDDSKDLGANDFANGDDLLLDDDIDLDLDADLIIDSNEDEPEMEEFNEFAGDDDFGGESNFDDNLMDDRFPEY